VKHSKTAPKSVKERRRYEEQTLSTIKGRKEFKNRTQKIHDSMLEGRQSGGYWTGLPWKLEELRDKYAKAVLDMMDTKKLSMTIAIIKAVPIRRTKQL
jgi:NADH:ubiquinone oxidoreductase subunit F (NADH-binding)